MYLPFEDGERYGVLVVDMQRDGVQPDGAIPAHGATDIIPAIEKLTTSARVHGWPVIHTQHVHRADLSDFGLSRHIEPPSCVDGGAGLEFVPPLQPQPGDRIVQKRRYSAFLHTDLDMLLRNLHINGLLICGILTDACVLSTVVDGRGLDYKLWMISDALAGTNPTLHNNALDIMAGWFADIRDTAWAHGAIATRPQAIEGLSE
ncbi:cysteine hydrolase family protein [Thermocrispum municipale]|uniref:cysteine hydrolase family protein n=1 Tax=Thermocrispum municipale TaxID=37926 RepID=UPI0006947408|nr:isochorismatase family cysteine hydrolase [Thermocrispum municipale]